MKPIFRNALYILIFAALSITFGCSESNDPVIYDEIRIGALIPFTGTYGQQGPEVLKALEFAVEDVNKELEQLDSIKRIKLVYDDTQTDGAVTKILMRSYINQGIRIIIGPMTSGELLEVEDEINNSSSMLISPSSTTTVLSDGIDNIFRLVPDDTEMAVAIAEAAIYNDIDNLAIIFREDAWGTALSGGIDDEFVIRGGTISSTASYYSYRESLYRECTEQVSTDLQNLFSQQSGLKVAVQLSSFDEGADILKIASEDSLLEAIMWFGSDGIARNSYLLEVPEAVAFARMTNFAAPVYQIVDTSEADELKSRLETALGTSPGTYTLISYDALRAAANVLLDLDTNEGTEVLRTRLFNELNGYSGITGSISLSQAGDRTGGQYDFWKLNDSGTPEWIKAFSYQDGSIVDNNR